MDDRSFNNLLRYGVAVVAVALAVLLRLLLAPLLNDRLPFLTLFAAVLFTAWYAGRWPGVLVMLLGSAAVVYFVLEPRYSFAIERPEYVFGLIFYAIISLGSILLFEQLRGAQRRAEEIASEARWKEQQLQQEAQVRLQAETAVSEEKERLRVTLASIGDGVITTDAEGRVVYLNDVARQLTGWTQQEAQGVPLEKVFSILHEQTRKPVKSPVEKVLREGVIVGLGNHTVLIANDGTERPIDDSAAPIRDATGKLIGVVLTFRDVAEQRQAEREVRENDARKRAILETALDCIITMDHEGKVVEFNPAAENTFGYKRADIVGQVLADFIIPRSLRESHRKGMADYLATGEGPVLGKRLELTALRADGSEFPIELAITRIPIDGPPLFTAYLRDITERTRAEQRRNARLAVTHALGEAASVNDGASGVLRAVCENLGWDVGFFWMVNDKGDRLVCQSSWHKPDVPVKEFETASRSHTFDKGEGLPGRAWASGKSAWILDITKDANFPRLAAAVVHSLHSAFACPIVVGEQMLGVIEFFTNRIREADADLVETMRTVAGNVGQFLERKVAEEELRQSEQELADFFENATVGMHWVGLDGIILRANRAELDMLGYSREEYVGRPISDFHADEEVICDILRRLQAGEKLNEYPARLRCKDGSIRDVLIDSSVMWRDGNFVHTRCFTTDVTERKRAEQRFTRFMQHLPGLAWIKDLQGRYIYANDAAKKAFRTPWAALAGRTDDEVFSPATAAQFKQNDQKAISGPVQVVEALQHEDGIVHYSLVNKFPIFGSDGQAALIGGMAIDITEQRRVEESLRESEQRFRLLVDHAPVLIWVNGLDGCEFVNRAYLEFLGRTLDEVRQMKWAEALAPEDAEAYVGAYLQAFESRQPFDAQFRFRRGDGEYRWLKSVGLPRFTPDGTFLGYVGCSLDITDMKRAEEELQRTEKQSRTILESITDAFCAFDRDWRFTYVNRQAEILLGRSRNDLLGKNHWDEYPDTLGTELERSYRRAVAENVTVTLEHFYPPHDRWYEVHAYPSPEGLSVYFRDVSQRWRAEAALRESEEKLRLLADTIPQLAWMARPDGYIFWYNQRWYEYTGTTPEQMEGWGWQSVHDPETLPKVLERWKGSIASGEPFDMVFPLKGADEQFRAFLTRVNPLRDAEGRILYWFGTNTDISDIKRMEEALRDADRRKDEFLATLAHELRNPLAPIRNSLQILKMDRVDVATVQQTRDMMERQVHHLVRLVDDLLDVSRVMRGKIELRKEPVELATVVARAVETAQPLIEVQGHKLDLSLPSESLLLDADPVRLAQVIGNLLTNSAKYTDANGHIWLTARREGDQAVLRVRDDGIGIAPDMLPHIFELFVQADHASTKAQGGLGIGLTLVKNLIEMHNGTVEARSDGLRKGSEFIFRLPLMVQERQSREKENGELPGEPARSSGHRLLVVDDNQDAAISLAMLLRLQGHEVRVAHSGPEALEMTKAYAPDAVFLDIGMPGMDGYQVARRMRQQPGLEKVVLAALTGWGQQEDRRRTAEAGFDHHLVKPPEPKALESVLAELKSPRE